MTTAEARKEVEFQMCEWGTSEPYSSQIASIDALIAAVRAEEQVLCENKIKELEERLARCQNSLHSATFHEDMRR